MVAGVAREERFSPISKRTRRPGPLSLKKPKRRDRSSPFLTRFRRRKGASDTEAAGSFRWSRYTALVQMGRAAMGQGRWQQVLACGALGLGFLIFAEIVLS
ncbi:hypothetical protein ES332_D01G106500v1 [Gossypium tomentosum]|uniref:Uncharacterized protein n=1 Tax=Gossypium tomentosum TaxID=34277 RepID=A0A5D2M7L1_GOSTO|nr:hypothetical protein ES332_D01G106500v1 [Gossypium tomentosum]